MVYSDITKRREAVQRRASIVKDFIRTFKDVPCADCGKEYPHYVMDFDHLGDKVREVSDMTTYSFIKIEAEIAKCEVVCANCHRTRTWNRNQHRRKNG